MAKVKYNHRARIHKLQAAVVKSIYPGTIIQFNYDGDKVFDKKPMVLVFWVDNIGEKIHGINLNYLSDYSILLLFDKIIEGADVYSGKRGKNTNIVTEEDQTEDKFSSSSKRNLLKDTYTRIKLPTYKEDRGGNLLGKAQAIRQMEMLYEKKLKSLIKKEDIYRSYLYNKITTVRVLQYDMEDF